MTQFIFLIRHDGKNAALDFKGKAVYRQNHIQCIGNGDIVKFKLGGHTLNITPDHNIIQATAMSEKLNQLHNIHRLNRRKIHLGFQPGKIIVSQMLCDTCGSLSRSKGTHQ